LRNLFASFFRLWWRQETLHYSLLLTCNWLMWPAKKTVYWDSFLTFSEAYVWTSPSVKSSCSLHVDTWPEIAGSYDVAWLGLKPKYFSHLKCNNFRYTTSKALGKLQHVNVSWTVILLPWNFLYAKKNIFQMIALVCVYILISTYKYIANYSRTCILPLSQTVLYILNPTWPSCAFLDDGDTYQPKRVGVPFLLICSGAISWNKFLSVWFKFKRFFLSFFELD